MRIFQCLAASVAVLCAQAAATGAGAAKFVTFDVPGARSTYPAAINAGGDIAGNYDDTTGQTHGFVRSADGTITSFDIAGATGIAAISINRAGAIAGWSEDSSHVEHGYIRRADGGIVTFDPTGSADTRAIGINDSGEVAGEFARAGADESWHGFTRQQNGRITLFDSRGSQLYDVDGINNAGTITGSSYRQDDIDALVRLKGGKTSYLSVPGAVCTYGIAINDEGAVAGFYAPQSTRSSCGNPAGFLANPEGQLSTFRPEGARITFAVGLNNSGDVVGYYTDAAHEVHGFRRAPNGAIEVVDAPGAGTARGQGTKASGINDSGSITGYYLDAENTVHGFLTQVRQ